MTAAQVRVRAHSNHFGSGTRQFRRAPEKHVLAALKMLSVSDSGVEVSRAKL